MYRQLFLLLILLIFTLSCTPSTIKIMPDYAKKSFGPQDLAVISLNDDISITNESDLSDDFGDGEPEVIFQTLIETLFPDKLKHYSKFRKVILTDSLDIPNPQKTSLSISDKRKIYVTIPAEGAQVKFDSQIPDAILFIDKFTTLREIKHSAGQWDNGVHTGGQSSDKLIYKVAFVLWDNKEGKIVSMGESVGSNSVFMAMNYKTWNKAFNEVAENIFLNTPYFKKQVMPPSNSSLPNPISKEEEAEAAQE